MFYFQIENYREKWIIIHQKHIRPRKNTAKTKKKQPEQKNTAKTKQNYFVFQEKLNKSNCKYAFKKSLAFVTF